MSRPALAASVLLFCGLALAPARAADPPLFYNPLKAFVRSPLSAELEIYSGGITGKSIGAGFKSAAQGDYGVRFTFGFLKALNFNVNYLYSNQTRSFTAFTPPIGTLPTGTAFLHAANLNMLFGNREISFAKTRNATFYFSPGVGFARNGARSMTLITPLGTASTPILAGTAVTFNLGTGVKILPFKHLGFRLDLRDHVSGGGTGNLNSKLPPGVATCTVQGCLLSNVQQYFGKIPINNNIVFTLGLIFKIL